MSTPESPLDVPELLRMIFRRCDRASQLSLSAVSKEVRNTVWDILWEPGFKFPLYGLTDAHVYLFFTSEDPVVRAVRGTAHLWRSYREDPCLTLGNIGTKIVNEFRMKILDLLNRDMVELALGNDIPMDIVKRYSAHFTKLDRLIFGYQTKRIDYDYTNRITFLKTLLDKQALKPTHLSIDINYYFILYRVYVPSVRHLVMNVLKLEDPWAPSFANVERLSLMPFTGTARNRQLLQRLCTMRVPPLLKRIDIILFGHSNRYIAKTTSLWLKKIIYQLIGRGFEVWHIADPQTRIFKRGVLTAEIVSDKALLKRAKKFLDVQRCHQIGNLYF